MAITTVLFDIGGVLECVDEDTWPQAWLEHWCAQLRLDPNDVMERLAEEDIPDTATTAGTLPAYRAAFGRALGLTQEQNDLMFADMWERYCGKANQPMIDLARSLQGRYIVAILSNSADGAREEEERRYGFSTIFDPILYSHELGIEKPDQTIFRLAAERCAAKPEQIIFIDDHEQHVDAALELGIHAILHKDNAKTIAAVNALLG